MLAQSLALVNKAKIFLAALSASFKKYLVEMSKTISSVKLPALSSLIILLSCVAAYMSCITSCGV